MTRLLVAPDSFGGTLSAVEAASAIAGGWRRTAPETEVDLAPLSDGGPGFVDVLVASVGGERRVAEVAGPLGRPVSAYWLLVGDTAYVESAQAAGLHLIPPAERRPGRTTTYGVGQLVGAALDAGVRRVVVGLGGTGTNDGGAGLLAALGLGGVPDPTADGLAGLDRVDAGRLRPIGGELVAATDVDNPLLGPVGASAVFGPQKGAAPEDVPRLDAALAHWVRLLGAALPGAQAAAKRPGAGAAGGLGYALLALGARREAGFAVIREATGLAERAAAADLVLTGEGRLDHQSLRGKVVSGVAAVAGAAAVPCVVLAGQVALGRRELAAAGVASAYAVAEVAGSVPAAMAEPARHLAALAERVARTWSRR